MLENIFLLIIIVAAFAISCVIIGADNLNEKRNRFKRKLDDMNELFRCNSCHRYSRKYYSDLKKEYDTTYMNKQAEFLNHKSINLFSCEHLCPHCENGIAELAYVKEKWIKKHPDAPLLTRKNFKAFEEMKESISLLMYEQSVNLTDKNREVDLLFNDMLLKISDYEELNKI